MNRQCSADRLIGKNAAASKNKSFSRDVFIGKEKLSWLEPDENAKIISR